MFEKCAECKRTMPDYMVEDYPMFFKSPLCPICAGELQKKMFGKSKMDPEVLEEANQFLQTQCKNNWGGHLINPPDECPYKFQSARDGGVWCDLGNCTRTCGDKCSRYYEYKRMTPSQVKDELYANGVVNA